MKNVYLIVIFILILPISSLYPKNHKWVVYNRSNTSLSGDEILGFVEDSQKNKWFIVVNYKDENKIHLDKLVNGDFENYKIYEDPEKTEYLMDFTIDSNDNLYLLFKYDIIKYDLKNKMHEVIKPDLISLYGIVTNQNIIYVAGYNKNNEKVILKYQDSEWKKIEGSSINVSVLKFNKKPDGTIYFDNLRYKIKNDSLVGTNLSSSVTSNDNKLFKFENDDIVWFLKRDRFSYLCKYTFSSKTIDQFLIHSSKIIYDFLIENDSLAKLDLLNNNIITYNFLKEKKDSSDNIHYDHVIDPYIMGTDSKGNALMINSSFSLPSIIMLNKNGIYENIPKPTIPESFYLYNNEYKITFAWLESMWESPVFRIYRAKYEDMDYKMIGLSKGLRYIDSTTEKNKWYFYYITMYDSISGKESAPSDTLYSFEFIKNALLRFQYPDRRAHTITTDFLEYKNGAIWACYNFFYYIDSSMKSFSKINHTRITPLSDIIKDSSGNIWFGTYGELFKYDGKIWKRYTNFRNNTAVCTSHDNKIIFGNVDGIFKFDGDTVEEIPQVWIKSPSSIILDKENNIWAASDSTIGKFDGKNWKFFEIYGNVRIHKLFCDNANIIWILSNKGFFKIEYGKAVKFNVPGDDRGATDMAEDMYGNYYFASGNSSLYFYDKKTFFCFLYMSALHLLYDSKGNLWIDKDNINIYLFNIDGVKLK